MWLTQLRSRKRSSKRDQERDLTDRSRENFNKFNKSRERDSIGETNTLEKDQYQEICRDV